MKSHNTLIEPTTNKSLETLLKNGFAQGMNYAAYKELIRQHVEAKTSTGKDTPPSYADYTALNEQRMKRLDKTALISEELGQVISKISESQSWLILTESWCGDAAQNIPYLEKAAEMTPYISTRYLLRDEHPEIMNQFLTNMGQAIPKLIAFNDQGEILFTWGPRPSELQATIMEYKKAPEPKVPYSEFQKTVQLWYLNNKGKMLQQELVNMMQK